MMIQSLVEKYRTGIMTDDHLVVECLHMLDPENPGLVLGSLPDNILLRMLRFATDYSPGRMVTNYGVVPGHDQVLAARHWIQESLEQKAHKTA